MVPKPKKLTREEFASLLTVGNTGAFDPLAVIPAEHSARLIALGYVADLLGRLRMTTPGRRRIEAGFEKQAATAAETLRRPLLRIGLQLDNQPSAAPKFNVATVYKAFGFFDCLGVVWANKRLVINEMAVITDSVGSIFGHAMRSLNQGAPLLSVTDGCRDGAVITKV
jgi:hypothetical protein